MLLMSQLLMLVNVDEEGQLIIAGRAKKISLYKFIMVINY